MIIITPDATKELRALAASGSAAVLRFDADVGTDGGYDCSVGLIEAVPADSKIEDIDGISVVFRGMAESIFAGSIVGLNADGDLTLEMAEGDCTSCEQGDCNCGEGDGCGEDCGEGGCH